MPKTKKKPSPKKAKDKGTKKKKILYPPPKAGTKPLGFRIKAWREAQTPPLTQVQAAKLLGLQSQTLESWEQGIRNPSFKYSEAILMRLIKDGF